MYYLNTGFLIHVKNLFSGPLSSINPLSANPKQWSNSNFVGLALNG